MEYHPLESLSAFIDHELSIDEQQQVQAHLEMCPSCKAVVEDLLLMQRQVFDVYHAIETPHHLDHQIMMAIDKRSAAQSFIRASLLFPAAAVVCLMAIWFISGSILSKIMSAILKFMIAGVYLLSDLFTSVPSVWALAFVVTVIIAMVSSISLRRLLRSST